MPAPVTLTLLDRLGINALFRFFNRKRPLILAYHGICDDGFDLLHGYDVRQIPRSLFRRQLEYLLERGYRFISLDEMLTVLRDGRKERGLVTLSFDDGLRNVVRNAYPVMQELGAKGTLFLVSSIVGSNKLLWTDHVETVVRNAPAGVFIFRCRDEQIRYPIGDEASRRIAMKDIKNRLRQLKERERIEHMRQFEGRKLSEVPEEFRLVDWDAVRSIDREVLVIGSHTRNHPNCTQLESDAEFESELAGSARDIEAQVGYPIRHFCYPAGSYDDRVRAKVAQHGYASALCSDSGFADASEDVYSLRRIEAEDSLSYFKARVSGSHLFFRALKSRLLGRPDDNR